MGSISRSLKEYCSIVLKINCPNISCQVGNLRLTFTHYIKSKVFISDVKHFPM